MPSVLIVDDLLSIHEMLDAVIQPVGFSTAFATDGEMGLARYQAEKFDLVLADIDMKPMDGLTLLKQLKQHDPNVLVIIMTAYASTETAVQALKSGAFDYLQKPFRVDVLIAALRRAMTFKSLQPNRSIPAVPNISSDWRQWPSLADYLAVQERHYIQMVLDASGADKATAAKVLGVDLQTLA
jgi:two-component system response regulator HydG